MVTFDPAMKIYNDLSQIAKPFTRAAGTIGNFDGVHLGHQALFCKVVELAEKSGGDSVAITFEPHPLKILRPDTPPKLISTLDHKAELIARSGIQNLICIPFTRDLARTPAREFVTKVIHETLGLKELVVGYDYALGRGREGDIPFLKAMGRELGFKVHVVPPYKVDGMIASSSKIRELVSQGEMRKVRALLGRYYQIRGEVQRGKRRGGPLVGFPTANLAIIEDDLCPKTGVYAVQVIHDRCCYGGVLNIGHNPTFGDTGLSAEVHIFDFDKEIYSHPIKVNLIERIRDEKRFSGPQELAAQIRKDTERARQILSLEQGLHKACLEG